MTEHHQHAAGNHGPVEAEDAVGEQAAEERQEVHSGGVRAVHAPDVGHVELQRLVHVERQDGHHRIEAVALPQLGEEQHVESRRMAA